MSKGIVFLFFMRKGRRQKGNEKVGKEVGKEKKKVEEMSNKKSTYLEI